MHIFYRQEMNASTLSSSPSAHKPREVMVSWLSRFDGLEIIPPKPVSAAQLSLAHDADFVADILACRAKNGFWNRDPAIAQALPYTTGAMLDAARSAVQNRNVAVAPCSGFHHAGWDYADGYCTFNGLMITALALKTERAAARVGILDFDHHYGDGTAAIIERLGLDWVVHYSAGAVYADAHQAAGFLAAIPGIVHAMAGCDVVLYQAGADPHVDDPLGGWLTTEQLRLRDRIVFETLAQMQIPVAWNLAGGYQKPLRKVLDIHDNTMQACLAVYANAARSEHT